MLRLLILAKEKQNLAGLRESLNAGGLACAVARYGEGLEEAVARQAPEILLVDMDADHPDEATWQLISNLKRNRPLRVMALVPADCLETVEKNAFIDEFIVSPPDARELELRARRLISRVEKPASARQIKCDGLAIDMETCEVAVDGHVVELTFKEYEMLKLLASHRGRVFTRESLLDRVWGYDYYGGDRTVDVHIRRLRSKIEDTHHAYIETVRNIGYRFRKEVST